MTTSHLRWWTSWVLKVRERTVVLLDAEGQVGMEVHMDDVHGFGPDPLVEKFKKDLAVHTRFRDDVVHHDGSENDHSKRFRQKFSGVTTIESNPKYLDAGLELLGLEGARTYKEQLTTGDLLEPSETTVYRQCVTVRGVNSGIDARESDSGARDSLIERERETLSTSLSWTMRWTDMW